MKIIYDQLAERFSRLYKSVIFVIENYRDCLTSEILAKIRSHCVTVISDEKYSCIFDKSWDIEIEWKLRKREEIPMSGAATRVYYRGIMIHAGILKTLMDGLRKTSTLYVSTVVDKIISAAL